MPPPSLVADDDLITVANGRHQGVDLYAWRGSGPRGSQRGTFLNTVATVIYTELTPLPGQHPD